MTDITNYPPKPRFTLRALALRAIGRTKLIGRAINTIEKQLVYIFNAIEETGNELWKANANVYANEPPRFRLLSSFAEGVDQLAVSACPPGWVVEAILPFPKDEYLKDFRQSASGDNRDVRNEFLEALQKASSVMQLPFRSPDEKDRGYRDAGSYLLRQIDLLIAVWDGMPPDPGGTGALAKEAHQGGVPVIWLSTMGNNPTPRLITEFDEHDIPIAPNADCTEGPLKSALRPIFNGPSAERNQLSRSPHEALKAFYKGVWHASIIFPCTRFWCVSLP